MSTFKEFIKSNKKVIEKLAELEHEQWILWAKNILKTENISEERDKRWRELFVDYSKLSEEMKDKDREWAIKAFKIMKENTK